MKLTAGTIRKWKRDALELGHVTQARNRETFLSVELIKQCNKTAMLALLLEEILDEQNTQATISSSSRDAHATSENSGAQE